MRGLHLEFMEIFAGHFRTSDCTSQISNQHFSLSGLPLSVSQVTLDWHSWLQLKHTRGAGQYKQYDEVRPLQQPIMVQLARGAWHPYQHLWSNQWRYQVNCEMSWLLMLWLNRHTVGYNCDLMFCASASSTNASFPYSIAKQVWWRLTRAWLHCSMLPSLLLALLAPTTTAYQLIVT